MLLEDFTKTKQYINKNSVLMIRSGVKEYSNLNNRFIQTQKTLLLKDATASFLQRSNSMLQKTESKLYLLVYKFMGQCFPLKYIYIKRVLGKSINQISSSRCSRKIGNLISASSTGKRLLAM
jgi:hypothetical protein